MDREESQLYYASKRERLLALTIFSLMFISFFLHVFAFGDIFLKNVEYRTNQTEIKKNNSMSITDKNLGDIFDVHLLPFFCLMAHLIWTIVPIVVLDQCCLSTSQSLYRIILKLFICTCPLLLCSELSIMLICHIESLRNDTLLIAIKWLIFFGTILISFWTGVLSDKDKWRGIHGGQIAPEHHSPLYLVEN